ncbi:MAG TPA: ATP-binding protein [Chloroflexota bacterium]|nr:ATP-binding protein [Chloroflexota bacterium]
MATSRIAEPKRRVSSEDAAVQDVPAAKILLVDDEVKNLTALESVLAAPDRELVRADSGAAALRAVLHDDFAVVLLDVHMPDVDGFETAELIRSRERSRETPIIFLTAAISGDVSIARGYSLGAVDYIVKPIDAEILRSKVNVFIDLFRKTEQVKRQAVALADTTAFLNSVLEGATAYAIMALDLDGTILSWNEGARRIFGYKDSEIVGSKSLARLVRAEDASARRVEGLLKAAREHGRVTSRLDGVRRNRSTFSAAFSVEQRVGTDGRLVGYVAIGQDITQMREAEEQRARLIHEQTARAEAERARDHLQQVLDVLPEGILIADADGRIEMCNATAVKIIGGLPDASDCWAAESLSRYRLDGSPMSSEELPLVRAIVQGETVLGEQLMISSKASANPIPVLMNSAPLRNADGRIVGGVAALQDITPIIELERQKDAFLAAASHDLKNPLAIVKAQAQLLMRRAGRTEGAAMDTVLEGLRSIDQATRRLNGMVNELLDVARLQMGRPIELDPKPVDLISLVREVASELQSSSDRHEILVECASDPIVGVWDRDRIERVIVNLVTNAIKYSPEGGRIELGVAVTTVGDDEWAELRVRDHGLGIPADEIPRIFERFYRGSNVHGHIEGAGIGLSGAQQIIDQHGGFITVESAEGKGTMFVVQLPGVARGRTG